MGYCCKATDHFKREQWFACIKVFWVMSQNVKAVEIGWLLFHTLKNVVPFRSFHVLSFFSYCNITFLNISTACSKNKNLAFLVPIFGALRTNTKILNIGRFLNFGPAFILYRNTFFCHFFNTFIYYRMNEINLLD